MQLWLRCSPLPLRIPLNVDERFVRASGPGGQNVNKVATAVELRFDIDSSSLPADMKSRLKALAGRKALTDGVLMIDSRVTPHAGPQSRSRARAPDRTDPARFDATQEAHADRKLTKAAKERRSPASITTPRSRCTADDQGGSRRVNLHDIIGGVSDPSKPQSFTFLKLAGPGLVVAATGIGSGDVVSATVGGARYGVVLLWAIVAGAFFKFVLSEGIARWQLATGKTALEGWADHLPSLGEVVLRHLPGDLDGRRERGAHQRHRRSALPTSPAAPLPSRGARSFTA